MCIMFPRKPANATNNRMSIFKSIVRKYFLLQADKHLSVCVSVPSFSLDACDLPVSLPCFVLSPFAESVNVVSEFAAVSSAGVESFLAFKGKKVFAGVFTNVSSESRPFLPIYVISNHLYRYCVLAVESPAGGILSGQWATIAIDPSKLKVCSKTDARIDYFHLCWSRYRTQNQTSPKGLNPV